MRSKSLDQDLAGVIRLITDRFISSREGTPVHLVKTQLRKKRNLLQKAVDDRYLRDTGSKYFPCFRALDLEDANTKRSVRECTTLVFKALKAIYERDGDRMCDQVVISGMCEKIDPSASAEAVTVGMLFAADFSAFIQLWNADPHFQLSLAASERLLDFEDLQAAWQTELRSRAEAAPSSGTAKPSASKTGTAPLVFETPGEVYTSQGTVGEGGSAQVFRVVDAGGTPLALKCLKPEQATSTHIKRFLNELEFCRHPRHPNIVQVVDQGYIIQANKKCPFYVMRLYPSTLLKLLRQGIPIEKRLAYFLQILSGVEAAHLKGVWHRDLKPQNVLHDMILDSLLVSDFGIAHFTTEELFTVVDTTSSERLANFQYAAPEQRRKGATVDHRADIYSLGLILNEMFTGHVLQGAGYKKISQVCPSYAYLDEIIDRMVQQDPENRYSSIDEVKLALDATANVFASRQKLDQLRDIVVPSASATDRFLDNPISVTRFDVRENVLVAFLNEEPVSEWVRVFVNQPVRAFVAGAEPANWRFSGSEAILEFHPRRLEAEAPLIVSYFENYVEQANYLYRQQLESLARQREETERQAHHERVAEEERRQRILTRLKRPRAQSA